MTTSEKVAQAYDSWSGDYDTCLNKTRDLDTIALRSQQLDLSEKTVIEIGCGTGRHTQWFAQKFGQNLKKLTGMDLSQVFPFFLMDTFSMIKCKNNSTSF